MVAVDLGSICKRSWAAGELRNSLKYQKKNERFHTEGYLETPPHPQTHTHGLMVAAPRTKATGLFRWPLPGNLGPRQHRELRGAIFNTVRRLAQNLDLGPQAHSGCTGVWKGRWGWREGPNVKAKRLNDIR
jgi:hypothetical protein